MSGKHDMKDAFVFPFYRQQSGRHQAMQATPLGWNNGQKKRERMRTRGRCLAAWVKSPVHIAARLQLAQQSLARRGFPATRRSTDINGDPNPLQAGFPGERPDGRA